MHYINNGLKEKRICNKKQIKKFDMEFYSKLYSNLEFNENILFQHWNNNKPIHEVKIISNRYVEYITDISIIIIYFNDKKSIINILNQFEKIYAYKYKLEVLIIDLNSSHKNKLNNCIYKYPFYINYIILNHNINYHILIDILEKYAKSDVLIVQNCSIFHKNNLIKKINLNKIENHFLFQKRGSTSKKARLV
jgi:hypothetical protein